MSSKRLTIGTLLAGIFAIVYGGQALAAITGSKHDFTTGVGAFATEICVVCHTPHNANVTVTDAPLWDHEVTATSFGLYTNGASLDAIVGQPAASSKLCLSCHDGTVALDSFGGITGTTLIGGGANLGTTLADDHPISFTYDTALATLDGELHDPSVQTVPVTGGTIDADWLLAGKVECASCHDVHNNGEVGAGKLLRVSNAASVLCLTCHNK